MGKRHVRLQVWGEMLSGGAATAKMAFPLCFRGLALEPGKTKDMTAGTGILGRKNTGERGWPCPLT